MTENGTDGKATRRTTTANEVGNAGATESLPENYNIGITGHSAAAYSEDPVEAEKTEELAEKEKNKKTKTPAGAETTEDPAKTEETKPPEEIVETEKTETPENPAKAEKTEETKPPEETKSLEKPAGYKLSDRWMFSYGSDMVHDGKPLYMPGVRIYSKGSTTNWIREGTDKSVGIRQACKEAGVITNRGDTVNNLIAKGYYPILLPDGMPVNLKTMMTKNKNNTYKILDEVSYIALLKHMFGFVQRQNNRSLTPKNLYTLLNSFARDPSMVHNYYHTPLKNASDESTKDFKKYTELMQRFCAGMCTTINKLSPEELAEIPGLREAIPVEESANASASVGSVPELGGELSLDKTVSAEEKKKKKSQNAVRGENTVQSEALRKKYNDVLWMNDWGKGGELAAIIAKNADRYTSILNDYSNWTAYDKGSEDYLNKAGQLFLESLGYSAAGCTNNRSKQDANRKYFELIGSIFEEYVNETPSFDEIYGPSQNLIEGVFQQRIPSILARYKFDTGEVVRRKADIKREIAKISSLDYDALYDIKSHFDSIDNIERANLKRINDEKKKKKEEANVEEVGKTDADGKNEKTLRDRLNDKAQSYKPPSRNGNTRSILRNKYAKTPSNAEGDTTAATDGSEKKVTATGMGATSDAETKTSDGTLMTRDYAKKGYLRNGETDLKSFDRFEKEVDKYLKSRAGKLGDIHPATAVYYASLFDRLNRDYPEVEINVPEMMDAASKKERAFDPETIERILKTEMGTHYGDKK